MAQPDRYELRDDAYLRILEDENNVIPPEENRRQPLKIDVENLIRFNNDTKMKTNTIFDVKEFLMIYDVVKELLEYRANKDARTTPKNKLFVTLTWLKHYENFPMLADNIDLKISYTREYASKLFKEFI